MKKIRLKCFKNGKNHGTIALSYPPFLLMIHYEETQLNHNHYPNPNLKGLRKCNSAKTIFTSRVMVIKMQGEYVKNGSFCIIC